MHPKHQGRRRGPQRCASILGGASHCICIRSTHVASDVNRPLTRRRLSDPMAAVATAVPRSNQPTWESTSAVPCCGGVIT